MTFQTIEDRIRFRILDRAAAPSIPGCISDISMPLSEFAVLNLPCQRVFIVEDEMILLTFPKIAQSIVIFGGGYKSANLRHAGWMKEKEIWYWGDLDIRGFDILTKLRSNFPRTRSLMMDMETFRAFEIFAVSVKDDVVVDTQNLSDAEHAVLQMLLDHPEKNRLEQDRITHEAVLKKLAGLGYQLG